MKDMDQLLEELGQNKEDFVEEGGLTELEERRIYMRTMQKIENEKAKAKKCGNKGKSPFWKKYSRFATAAAAVGIVCMISVTAVAAFGLDQNIKNFFGIYDKVTEKRAEKLVSSVDAKAVSNGVEISVSQMIGDRTRFYVVLNAKDIPDEPYMLEFGDVELTVEENGKTYDYTMEEPQMGGINGNITKFSFLVSDINDNGKDTDINGKKVNLSLNNLGYYENADSFVPIVKGNWKLNWTFHTEAKSEKVAVNKKVQLMDSEGIWKDIEISPLSLSVHFNIVKQGKTHFSEKEWEKYEDSDRLTVRFTDGSCIDSRFTEDVNESWGTKEELGHKSIGFHKIVDAKEIQSVTFGKKTVVLRPGKNSVRRIRVSSKAVNCSIDLPKELKRIVTLKERLNVKNSDFHCREAYTIFFGKKNKVGMPLFTIHRLKGMFSPDDVEEKNPMMTYIGYRAGYTYTIEYGEIQNEKQDREFAEIINKYISNILPYFEYLS